MQKKKYERKGGDLVAGAEAVIGSEHIVGDFLDYLGLEHGPHPLLLDNVVDHAWGDVGVKVCESGAHKEPPEINVFRATLLLLRKIRVVH